MQYLCNNLENAKNNLIYSVTNIDEVQYQRGEVNAYNDVLGLCDYLDKLKIATEEDKKRLESLKKTEPMQAIVEGKTFFNKEDLGL